MANVIDYVQLPVNDLEQAMVFYTKALGWSFNDYGPDHAGIKDPSNPGQEFGGLSPSTPSSLGEGVLALVRSENADDALASVLAAGGRIQVEMHD
jgi:predicted enzyme related to lactoylglutathione lyase